MKRTKPSSRQRRTRSELSSSACTSISGTRAGRPASGRPQPSSSSSATETQRTKIRSRTPDGAILELSRQGLTAAEIGARLGTTARTVQRVRAFYGLSRPDPRCARRISEEELAQVPAMLEDGWPLREVARTTGISEATLYRHFRGQGWTPREAGEWARLNDRVRPVL